MLHRQGHTTAEAQRHHARFGLTFTSYVGRLDRARILDQAADHELTLGHPTIAERLAHRADELRQGVTP